MGRYSDVKRELIERYGGRCVACGCEEMAVLSLDHINDDGHEEKRSTGKRGFSWYTHVLRQPLRDDLQVLCMSCQYRKRNYGKDFATWPVTRCPVCGGIHHFIGGNNA